MLAFVSKHATSWKLANAELQIQYVVGRALPSEINEQAWCKVLFDTGRWMARKTARCFLSKSVEFSQSYMWQSSLDQIRTSLPHITTITHHDDGARQTSTCHVLAWTCEI